MTSGPLSGAKTGRTGERLGTNQALAQVKNPQNQGPIAQIYKLMLSRLQRLTEAMRQRSSSRCLMLNGVFESFAELSLQLQSCERLAHSANRCHGTEAQSCRLPAMAPPVPCALRFALAQCRTGAHRHGGLMAHSQTVDDKSPISVGGVCLPTT